MVFAYQIYGPDFPNYKPGNFVSRNYISAINFLENLIPVHLFNEVDKVKDMPDVKNAGHTLELWELEKVKDTEPSKHYQLIPQKGGHLACDALVSQLWEDLQKDPDSLKNFPHHFTREMAEEWCAEHHTKGMNYLRYGNLGEKIGEQRLAEIGRNVLENIHNILEDKNRWEAVCILNQLGLSYEDCDKAGVLLDTSPRAVVYQSTYPLSAGDEEKDKQAASSFWSTDPRHLIVAMKEGQDVFPYQNMYVDGKCIAQLVNGKVQEPDITLTPEDLDPYMQNALSAVQAFKAGFDSTKSITFLVYVPGEELPDERFSDVTEFSAKKGVYNAETALKAFQDLGDVNEKRLYMVFQQGNNWIANPVLSQYGSELCCEPPVHSLMSRRAENLVSEILSKAFPDKTFNIDHFAVKIIAPGDTYGVSNHLTNNYGKPIVRFHDANYKGEYFDPEGQFTGGEYYLETLVGKDKFNGCQDASYGLDLNSEVPDWNIPGSIMQPIVQWLKVKYEELQPERKPSLNAQMSAAEAKNKAQERNEPQKGTVYHERD